MYDDIRMVRICDDAVIKLLYITYKNCIEIGIYPDIWKKSIVPVQEIKN